MRLILFVCGTNRGRSPMAATYFASLLKQRNIKDMEVASAGLTVHHGDTIYQEARQVLAARGLTPLAIGTVQLLPKLVRAAELIICMTDRQQEIIESKFPSAIGKCRPLSAVLKEDMPGMKSCVEAKLFGIGLESYTVGSMDFFEGYCATRKVIYTLDTGHYEPTENVADKVSSLLLYVPELMLHVSRPVRWDSDHVTIMNDMTLDFFKELVRADGLNRAHVGLDYFDASINRIGAYIIGTRATQKCILSALLEPLAKLRELEAAGKGFQKLALLEEAKTLPFGAVFDYFNYKNGVPVGEEFIPAIEQYEKDVTSKR